MPAEWREICKISLRSSPLPKSGQIASVLGFPIRPPEFTIPPNFTISRYVSGAWVPYMYNYNNGNPTWSPSEPLIGIGEAFRIDYSTTGSTTWTKDYWAWSPF